MENMLGKHIENLRNMLRTLWEPDENTLGTHWEPRKNEETAKEKKQGHLE
jgi:hypothetical protein